MKRLQLQRRRQRTARKTRRPDRREASQFKLVESTCSPPKLAGPLAIWISGPLGPQ